MARIAIARAILNNVSCLKGGFRGDFFGSCLVRLVGG
jgi:hypothetical protein